jgi:predicted amidohydrolase YtcJ
MRKIQSIIFAFLFLFNWSCETPEYADVILINGNIATLDSLTQGATAIAIKDGRFLKIGTNKEIQAFKNDNTKIIDLQGNFTMPGFIEGHGHFSGMGKSLLNINLMESKNWAEIVNAVAENAKTVMPGEWIYGHGWHQEKWDTPLERQFSGYPYHDQLSEVSPDNPVILVHASGHSIFANKKAMEIVGLSKETPSPDGGDIVRDPSGEALGVFEETAAGIIGSAYWEYIESLPKEEVYNNWLNGIKLAEKECLSKGITSFQDAGSSFEEINYYKKLAENGDLDLRLWVMIRHSYEKMKGNLDGFPIKNIGNHFLTVNAIKSEVDGALGSYGAWLLQSYDDKPNFVGQNTTTISEVKNIAGLAYQHDLQLCVHAIGDRANREVLNIFEENFKSNPGKKDLRWRIEHAQHLDPADIPRFKELGVIASMQGIHCTSDSPFVVKRLGEQRARVGAYPWRSLLDNGVVIANGTDAPVEDVDPIPSFYASVTRKRADTGFEFFPEQRMTRQEALYSYTLGNAYAAFEENDKGSISIGKLADIVVLSNDLLHCSDEEVLQTEVIYTIVGGEVKYQK